MNWHKVHSGHYIASNPAAEFTVRRQGANWYTTTVLKQYPWKMHRLYRGPSLEDAMNAAKLEEQEI